MATVNDSTTALYRNFPTNISMTVNATRIAGTTSVTISGSVSVSQPGTYNLDPIQAWLTDDNTGTQLGPDIEPKPADVASGTANFSYTVNVGSYSAGSRNISAHFFCVDASYGQADLTATVSYGSAYTAPATPTISAVADSPTQITITYGTTSFGNPSTGTVYLYGGTSAAPTTQINSKTTTGNSTYVYSGLTPNTTYYFRSRANNGQLNSNYSTEINVTTPAPAYKLYGPVSQQVLSGVTGVVRAGGAGNIVSLDGDDFWTAYGSLISTTKTMDYLLVNKQGTVYTVTLYYTDTTTTLLESDKQDVLEANGFVFNSTTTNGDDYIDLTPVYTTATLTKQVTKLYGPLTTTRTLYFITNLTNNVDFDAEMFTTEFENYYGDIEKEPASLSVTTSGGTTTAFVIFSDNTSQSIFIWTSGSYNDEGADWGFASEPQDGVFTSTSSTETETMSKEIIKLYGSVNGQTKRIF